MQNQPKKNVCASLPSIEDFSSTFSQKVRAKPMTILKLTWKPTPDPHALVFYYDVKLRVNI